MKRKFLSVMLAACAAVFSFSGLTGCSGGGNDEENYGIVTLEDFRTLSKGFNIALGTVMIIRPTDQVLSEHYGDDIVIMNCDLDVGTTEAIKAQVTYHLDWPDDQEYPTPGNVTNIDATDDPNAFTGTYLVISLKEAAKITDDSLKKAMGEPTLKSESTGSINIAVNFAANRCTMAAPMYTYDKDNVPSESEVYRSGPCYAQKF